jgi:hypothetical protein
MNSRAAFCSISEVYITQIQYKNMHNDVRLSGLKISAPLDVRRTTTSMMRTNSYIHVAVIMRRQQIAS